MTKLDTIQLTTSTDFIQDWNNKLFKISKTYKPNGLELINHTLNTKSYGINKININQTFEQMSLNISSKILGKNYFKGICLETIEQLIEELAKKGLKLDKEFINQSQLKFADVKNDLSLTNQNTSLYFSTLSTLIAPKFVKTTYDTGISFNEKAKTNPIRCTIYDKQIEIQNDKAFFKSINFNLPKYTLLRFESRFAKASTIKKYFKSNNFFEVLSKSNINSSIFDKIINKQTNFKPMIYNNEITKSEEKNFAYTFYLNTLYNGNFEQIVKHIKSKHSSNTKIPGLKSQVTKHLSIINNSNNDYNANMLNEIIDNLKEK